MSLVKFILICIIFFIPAYAHSAHLHPEKYYQDIWCSQNNGVTEYRLADETRVDCLTDKYAIEFDFAQKWAESIGQALYYSYRTGKVPGVVLILEKPSDYKYYERIKPLCDKYGIMLFKMEDCQ